MFVQPMLLALLALQPPLRWPSHSHMARALKKTLCGCCNKLAAMLLWRPVGLRWNCCRMLQCWWCGHCHRQVVLEVQLESGALLRPLRP